MLLIFVKCQCVWWHLVVFWHSHYINLGLKDYLKNIKGKSLINNSQWVQTYLLTAGLIFENVTLWADRVIYFNVQYEYET